jgi:hypothetical protein
MCSVQAPVPVLVPVLQYFQVIDTGTGTEHISGIVPGIDSMR